MPTSRQTLPTTHRETPAFKVNCVPREELAFVSLSGAFSRVKEVNMSKVSAVKRESFHWMTGSLRSCVCVTLWAATKGRPFCFCRITAKKRKRWCMIGGGGGGKKGGLAFETIPAQMYKAGGLSRGCRDVQPPFSPLWPFVAPGSLGMVSCRSGCA